MACKFTGCFHLRWYNFNTSLCTSWQRSLCTKEGLCVFCLCRHHMWAPTPSCQPGPSSLWSPVAAEVGRSQYLTRSNPAPAQHRFFQPRPLFSDGHPTVISPPLLWSSPRYRLEGWGGGTIVWRPPLASEQPENQGRSRRKSMLEHISPISSLSTSSVE